jgi:hypothetical protein
MHASKLRHNWKQMDERLSSDVCLHGSYPERSASGGARFYYEVSWGLIAAIYCGNHRDCGANLAMPSVLRSTLRMRADDSSHITEHNAGPYHSLASMQHRWHKCFHRTFNIPDDIYCVVSPNEPSPILAHDGSTVSPEACRPTAVSHWPATGPGAEIARGPANTIPHVRLFGGPRTEILTGTARLTAWPIAPASFKSDFLSRMYFNSNSGNPPNTNRWADDSQEDCGNRYDVLHSPSRARLIIGC